MHRAHYDLVVARAVAAMPVLADWLIPLARPSGLVVAYKSRDVSEEIAAARPKIAAQGADFERAVEIALPETDIVRTLVRIRKRRIVSGRATPTGGPR
jgi:16S rRNA (guanine527-N7)-methyltransferase